MKTNLLHNPAHIVFIVFILAMNHSTLFGQLENHLILKKRNITNLHHFLPGDPITFIRQGNSFDESGTIQGISTDKIIIGGQEIPVRTIETVLYQRKSFNYRAGGSTIALASPLYLALGAVNSLIRNERPIWTPVNFAVAGGILASGLAIRTLQVKKYKLGPKYQLKIVQSDPFLQKDKKNR
jgi:hypothetical protein